MLAQALGNGLPYADRRFATVISNSVLEHIPQVDDVLAEIARVLQPGGRFIFCVPGDHFPSCSFSRNFFAVCGWKPWRWRTNATLTASRGITTAMARRYGRIDWKLPACNSTIASTTFLRGPPMPSTWATIMARPAW